MFYDKSKLSLLYLTQRIRVYIVTLIHYIINDNLIKHSITQVNGFGKTLWNCYFGKSWDVNSGLCVHSWLLPELITFGSC